MGCPRHVPKGFNQASYYIPKSNYPPVGPPGDPEATRRPPTWPAVAFSAFVPQSLKQKNPKCPKTADTEKSPDHDQPTIVTCPNGARKVVCKCACLGWVIMGSNGFPPVSLHFSNKWGVQQHLPGAICVHVPLCPKAGIHFLVQTQSKLEINY